MHDEQKVDRFRLQQLGAAGVMSVGKAVQAVFGPASENLKTDMEQVLRKGGDAATVPASTGPVQVMATAAATSSASMASAPNSAATEAWVKEAAPALLAALGGRDNLEDLAHVAHTRLRVQVRDAAKVRPQDLHAAGADATLDVGQGVFHLLLGEAAGAFAAAMR